MGYFVVKGGNMDIFILLMEYFSVIVLLYIDFFKNFIIDNINIFYIVCRYVRFDMCVKIVDIFFDLINEIIEKGWNVVFFIIEKVGVERERIEILYFLEKCKLNVYYVFRLGKIILYNVCVNWLGKFVKYLLSCYFDLMNIEKLMDLRKVSKFIEIEEFFR